MTQQWNTRAHAIRGDQRYLGPSLYGDSYAVRKLPLVGQVSRDVEGRLRRQNGRYLSGLGGEQPDGRIGVDPAYQDQATYDLEQQDDTFGSGIFDPGSRPGTSNSEMGVFASHYSWPGYLAREVPFTVSRDVSDITDGADVVSVPAGGMTYVERKGRLTRPAVLGPTWRPKGLTPAGITSRDQPYAFLNYPNQPYQPPLNASAPVQPVPRYSEPARNPKYWTRSTGIDRPECGVPKSPREMRVPRRSMVTPQGAAIAVRPPGACFGFGQEPEKKPASTGQLLAAGVIAGAALGLVALAVKKK